MIMGLTSEQARAMGRKGGLVTGGAKKNDSLERRTAREHLIQKIKDHTDELFEAWKDCALGHYIEVQTPDGKTQVYKKSPDAKAIKDMFDRAFGKADQKLLIDFDQDKKITDALDMIAEATIIDIDPHEPLADTSDVRSPGETSGDSA
jgi:hypothetical protein